MRLRLVISLLFWFGASVVAFAGNDAGNGGHGLVCPNSVQFFDLWYATKELQLKQITSTADARTLGREMVLRLSKADPETFDGLMVSFANVMRAKVRVSDELELIPPRAFLGNLVPAADTGCQILPLAVYADSGVLLTSGPRWDALQASNVHTAAFLVHESIGDLLRQRALKAGKVLNEDVRKQIARDTVNLTALTFSPLSETLLKRRIDHYWKTGEAFQKAKVERVDSKYYMNGETVVSELDSAKAELRAKCEAWRKAQLARLEPLSEFALIECGGVGGYNVAPNYGFPAQWLPGTSAKITIVPKEPVLKTTEVIPGAMFPYQSGHGLSSIADLTAKSKAWRESNEKLIGSRLFLMHEGGDFHRGIIEREWQWRMHFAGEWRSGYTGIHPVPHDAFAGFAKHYYDKRALGDLDNWVGEVSVVLDSEVTLQTSTINGERYQFYSPANEAVEQQAAAMALESWRKACDEWKVARYREGAVLATCTTERPNYRVSEGDSLAWFTTEGKAWFPEK